MFENENHDEHHMMMSIELLVLHEIQIILNLPWAIQKEFSVEFLIFLKYPCITEKL